MKHTLTLLTIAVLLTGCSPQSCDNSQSCSRWQSIFNGKDLSGWHVRCLPADKDKTFWSVEDGAIECDSVGRPDHNYVWLMSDNEYDNFHLKMKLQVFRSTNGNSGVQFRSRYDDSPDAPNGGWLNGPQVDIHPPGPFRTGLIYDETQGVRHWIYPSLKGSGINKSQVPPAALETTLKYADGDPDAWNTLEIVCDGMQIQTFVNGRQIADYDATGVLDNEVHKARNVGTKGHIALQLHTKDQLRIRFKDIIIRKIKQ